MFLILKDYVFNLDEIKNAISNRDGNTFIRYKDGTEWTYNFLKFSDFTTALENVQKADMRGEKK